MLPGFDLAALLATYGYWAVLIGVTVESMGLPLPGETMLLLAAISAGITHQLSIALVIGAAAAGALLGDNIGYLVGRLGGERLLRRFGQVAPAQNKRLAVARLLFRRHGGKVVFFGRFVAVLRIFAAFLAGATAMPWRRFVLANAAGGVIWATIMGLIGYGLGASIQGPLGYVSLALAALVMAVGVVTLRRNEQRWAQEAAQLDEAVDVAA